MKISVATLESALRALRLERHDILPLVPLDGCLRDELVGIDLAIEELTGALFAIRGHV